MKRIIHVFVLLITIIICGIQKDVLSSVNTTIYFYNPENNINNFSTLKTEFDSYLNTKGNYQFQPFSDKNIFENAITNNRNNIYILSSWHYQSLKRKKIPLEIALLGTKKGESMQRKVLSAKLSMTGLDGLNSGTVIAGAGSEDYIRSVLKQIFGANKESVLADINILTVPKDIDALMAVGFSIASAALTAEDGLAKLALINPKQFQQMHTLGSSEKDYRLMAVTFNKFGEKEKPLLEILKAMQNNTLGETKLKLLGIDGWKPFEGWKSTNK